MADLSKNVLAKPQTFIVRPAPGWLDITQSELKEVLLTPISKYKFAPQMFVVGGAIRLKDCDFRQGLEVTMRLLTAHDVEWVVSEGACSSAAALDRRLGQISFASFLSSEVLKKNPGALHVQTQCKQSFVGSSRLLKERLHEVMGLQGLKWTAPDADEPDPAAEAELSSETVPQNYASLRLKLTMIANKMTLTMSMAGEPLYKRGYKAVLSATAPLPEHHGAAAFRWLEQVAPTPPKKALSHGNVLVPFAGTGTLGFEALLSQGRGGGGVFKRGYAFEEFSLTPAATTAFIRKSLRLTCAKNIQERTEGLVYFSDINNAALSILKLNVTAFSAGVAVNPESRFGSPELADFFSMVMPKGKIDWILLNPPYGVRLAKGSSAPSLYGRVGAQIAEIQRKQGQAKIRGYCLCPDERTWSAFLKSLKGLDNKTRHFTQGGIDMRAVAFWGR